MYFDVNFLSVFLGVVAFMMIGMVWYNPSMGFGNQWMKLSGLKAKDIDSQKGMQKMMTLGTLYSLLMAYGVNVVLSGFGITDMKMAIHAVLFVWLVTTFAVIADGALYDNKPFKLVLINSGYYLASYLAAAVIFVLFQ